MLEHAILNTTKIADKVIAYPGEIITYQFTVKNTGTLPANQVVIQDQPAVGTTYVAGSLVASVAVSGDPDSSISLNNPIAAGQMVTLSFQVKITSEPNPNPIQNVATVLYEYIPDPQMPDIITATSMSNVAVTTVFKYNYSQQINDLIQSIALQETALAAIANAEGIKIQKMVAMEGVTTQELLCLNKSVADMLDSISMLQNILKQKINTVNCQINGPCI